MSRGRGGKRSWGDNGWGEWGGYMNAKKQKLAEQFTADTPRSKEVAGEGSGIFEGVSIHVNGYTVPSSDELKRLMMLHGGMYYHYYSKTKVTHIIATRLPYAKIKELRDEKIVRPDWILESIKAGKQLSDIPYQLYTNRVTSQGTLKFTNKDVPAPHKGNPSTSSSSRQMSNDVDPEFQNKNTGIHETQIAQPESPNGVELKEMDTPSLMNRQNASVNKTHSEAPPGNSTDYSVNESPLKSVQVKNQNLTSPRIGKAPAKAGDANFVSEFYSNSRLHYISTWGAEFKAYVNTLQSSGDTSFPGREKLRRLGDLHEDSSPCSMKSDKSNPTLESVTRDVHPRTSDEQRASKTDRVIMHVDMDCFFVSVGLRNRPDLIGKPVAVTHSRGKGMPEANQESREYERAYYANKYKQDGGKGMKSRRIDPAKLSLQEKDDSSRDNSPAGENVPTKSDDTICLNSSSHSEHNSTTLPSTTGTLTSPGMPEPTNQSEPQKAKPKPNFNSMAEIASCSYEARKAGLRNGMFMGEAKRLCPELQTIPYDFEGYKKVSQTLYETIASYTHDIEAVSCDEMFVDVTGIMDDTGVTPLELAKVLRAEIKEKTGCNASAGLACNILLARMSTRKAKPDGQFYLDAEDAVDFMKQQPVKDLPGVGWSTGSRLRSMGIETCGDLQDLTLGALQKEFGPKTGQALYSYCRGIDDRPIRVERERKSVSAEINYGIRFTQNSEADTFVSELAAEVHRRLTAIKMMGKTITLKLKVRREGAPKETSKFMGHGICDNLGKSTTLAQSTDKLEIIQEESKTLLSQMRVDASDLRGVGIQISRLCAAGASTSSVAPSNKSLLDFVKPLSKTDEAASKPREQTKDRVPIEKKNSRTLLNFISKQKPAQGNVEQLKPTPLPPLPSFEPDVVTPSRRVASRADQEEFCLPSPSQLDPSVLAALPLSIRKNIERAYQSRSEQQNSERQVEPVISSVNMKTATGKFVPSSRRPMTESTVTPCASGRTITAKSTLYIQDEGLHQESHNSFRHSNQLQPKNTEKMSSIHSTEVNKNAEVSTCDQPSTSYGMVRSRGDTNPPGTSSGTDHSRHRYDPSVLRELPPDILQEIMGQETGGGRVRTEEHHLELESLDQEDASGPVEALPSFSQIDPSCLEALPSDLQKEIQRAYQRQLKTPIIGPSSKPPAPKSSPFKLNRRRGRPRKTSPRKGARQGVKLPGTVDILEMVTGVKSSPVGRASSGISDESNATEYSPEVLLSSDIAESKDTIKGKPVNLCGAVALWDVKEMLKEWTTSVEEPGDEDIDHLVLYLNQLIMDRNLEMTDLVLRGMKRLANQMESTSPWRDAYQIIEDRVQDTISQIYKSKLKIV